MKQLITIAGNIGAGKTTLGKHLSERINAFWLPESAYSNQFEHLIVNEKASNKKIMQLAFSSMRAATIISALLNEDNSLVVAERGMYDSIVFHKAWVQTGAFEDDSEFFDLYYKTLLDFDVRDYGYSETIIWLKCPVHILTERLLKRSKISDVAHTELLLNALDDEYVKMFSDIQSKNNIAEYEILNTFTLSQEIDNFIAFAKRQF